MKIRVAALGAIMLVAAAVAAAGLLRLQVEDETAALVVDAVLGAILIAPFRALL